MDLNQRERTIKIKIVYYGPPVGGKTTNLKILHQGAYWSRRGELVSVNSAQDRTILFDFLPLKASGFRGFDLRLQLVGVPGQAMYAASRKVGLRATDGIVFVANSAVDRWEENIQSYREMVQYLSANLIDPASVPLILQYNKRDLPEVMPVESLDHGLNSRKVQAIEAVASRGVGVLETFSAIMMETIGDLSRRYRTLEMAKGQTPQAWVAEAVDGIFGGKKSLAVEAQAGGGLTEDVVPSIYEVTTEPLAHAPEYRTVKISMEEMPRPPLTAAQHTRMQESLVESYVEASTELSGAADELRRERDRARERLEQVCLALEIGDDIAAGKAVVADLIRALGCLSEAGGGIRASFLLSLPGGAFRALLRPPLTEDPLLKTLLGKRCLENFRTESKPVLVQEMDTPDLTKIIATSEQYFTAMVVVPLRTQERLLGFAVLYYLADTALPPEEAMAHLGLLARIFRVPLELAVERGVI